MKKIAQIILASMVALSTSVPSWADSYCPKKGEEFVFYPVSNVYKQVIKGFDCFYVPELAYKNGKTLPEREYRFRVDANGVTPYSEIEGHTFVIETAMKENADKPVSQQNFLCFLVRDDGERLLLRIPFVRKSSDNTLTRGMTVILNEKNSFRQGPSLCLINIPACPVEQLETLSASMKGQDLWRYAGRDVDMTVSTLVKYLNKDLGDAIIKSSTVHCDSIEFVDVKGYVFSQPVAFGNLQGRKIKLPVFDFRGNGESVYGSYFSINTVFRAPADEKKAAVSQSVLAMVDDPVPAVADAAPATVEPTPKPVESTPKPVEAAPKPVEAAPKPVEAKVAATNTVVAATAAEEANMYIIEEVAENTNLWVLDEKPKPVKSNKNVEVASAVELPSQPMIVKGVSAPKKVVAENPVEITTPVEVPNPALVVKSVSAPKQVVAANTTEPAKTVEIAAPEITVKAEGPDPEIVERLAKERLASLTKRFGAKNAALIASGKIAIGFTQDMCKEALGEPDYINTTQNVYTTLEQWVYGHNRYLYFQRGKLQSVDEF